MAGWVIGGWELLTMITYQYQTGELQAGAWLTDQWWRNGILNNDNISMGHSWERGGVVVLHGWIVCCRWM